jgi:hypothetical protein
LFVFVLGTLTPLVSLSQSWTIGTSYPQGSAQTTLESESKTQIVIADLDGDGMGDVAAVVQGQLVLLKGDGKGGLTVFPAQQNLPAFVSAIAAADFTGDGKIDLLVLGQTTAQSVPSLLLLVNQGNGQFGVPSPVYNSALPALDNTCRLAAGVFTSAGTATAADFALSCQSAPASVFIGANSGDGTFAAVNSIEGVEQGRKIGGIQGLTANADGTQNLAVRSFSTSVPGGAPRIDWLMNQKGVFTAQQAVVPASYLNYLADYDGDGIPDSFASAYGVLSAQRAQASGFAAAQTINTWSGCYVSALGAGQLQNNAGSSALDLVAALLCNATSPATGHLLTFVPMLNSAATGVTITQLASDGDIASFNIAVSSLGGLAVPAGQVGVRVNSDAPEYLSLSDGSAVFTATIPDVSENILVTYSASDRMAASSAQTVLAPAPAAVTSSSTSSSRKSASALVRIAAKSDLSAQSQGSGLQAPTATTVASSVNPSTYGQSTTLTALVSTGGTVPTGTVTFDDGGSSIGPGTLSTVSTTNLVPYSSQFSSSTSWSNSGETVTSNAATAPDGTNSGTLIVPTDTNQAIAQFFPCSPGAVTASAWVMTYNANPATNFVLGVEFWNGGTFITAIGIVPAILPVWQRYSMTGTAPAGTTQCYLYFSPTNVEGVSVPGEGAYVWGVQDEQSPNLGPYVATGAASATGSGGLATFNTSTLAVGGHSITAVYGGDTNDAGSTSPAQTQQVNQAATITQVSSSVNPSTYGQSATLTALVNTGRTVPTGTVTFTNNGASIGTGSISTVTATNLIPNSQTFGNWNTQAYLVPLPTAQQVSVAGPNGTSGNAESIQFPAASGGAYSSLQYWDTTTLYAGKTVTFSVWLKAVSPVDGQSVQIGMADVDTGLDGNYAVLNLTTVWQRFSVTAVIPASENNDPYYFYIFSGPATTSTVYAWGPQVEFASTAGPYVATSGAFATGSGGVATLSISSLPVGSDSITAVYGGDSSDVGSISPVLTQQVNQAATITQVSSSVNPSTYGQSTTLSAFVNTGGTVPAGTVIFEDSGASIGTGTLSTVSTTNLAPHSSQFSSSTSWSNSGETVTSNATTAPDGTNSGTLIVANTYWALSQFFPCSPGSVTTSAWVMKYSANPATNFILLIEFWNGDTVITSDGIVPATLPVWQRDSMTFTAPAGTTQCYVAIGPTNVEGVSVQGEGAYVWGVQVEQSPNLGPYVATGAASATGSGGLATFNTSSLAVGNHSITAVYGGDTNDAGSTSPVLTQQVNKVTPTISASCSPNPVAYSQGTNCTAIVSSGATGNVIWTFNGGAWGTTALSGGSTSTGANSLAGYPAGTYPAVATYIGDGDNNSVVGSTSMTINKAPLTITASSTSVSYGTAAPTITPSYATFVNNDTSASLTTQPTCSTTYTTTSAPGSYPTTCSGAADSNYSISYVAGSITVSKAASTITFAQPATPVTYGVAPISLSASASSGLAVAFTAAGPCSVSGTTLTVTSAGSCVVTANQAGNANYSAATAVAHTIVVNQASLTITPTNEPKTYGITLALSAFTVSGLQNSDTVSSVTLASTGTPSTAAVGSYAITASGAAGSGLTNYSITYNTGTLTVTKAILTVTANNASMTYGGTVPGFTPSYSGFQNGDTSAVLIGSPSLTTSATSSSAVGSYTIASAAGTLSATNYSFSFVNGTLTVAKATLAVALSSSANPSNYGGTAIFTASVSGGTGTVTFLDGLTPLQTVSLTSGSASLTTQLLSVGSHSITAQYSGDSNFNGTTSSAVTQVVNKAAAAIAESSTENPSPYGDSVTITFAFSGSLAVPTGSATITEDGVTMTTIPLDGSGKVSYTGPALMAGSHTIKAIYGGDVNYF